MGFLLPPFSVVNLHVFPLEFMNRVLGIAERNAFPNGAAPIECPAGVAVNAIEDQTVEPRITEISGRYVQNTGANPCYYAIGQDASPTNHHGVLVQYAQLDCSSHRQRVSIYSTSGTEVSVLIIYRNDLGRNNTVLPTS